MTLERLPLPLLAAIGLGVFVFVVVMYTVRWRLPRRVISTTALWIGTTTQHRGGGRLGVLDHVLSLLLQLVVGAALVLALGQPRLSCQSAPGRAVVLVLDRSASMGTLDPIEPRFELAKRRALTRVAESAASDRFALVHASGDPKVAQPLTLDRAVVQRAIASSELSSAPGRLAEAVALGCSLLSGQAVASLVVVTDGSEPMGRCEGVPLEPILLGQARSNLGITAFAAGFPPRDPLHAEAFVELLNAAPSAAHAELRLAEDERLLEVAEIDLAPGQSVRRTFGELTLGDSGRLVARLARIRFDDRSSDMMKEDDAAYLVAKPRAKIPVQLIGASSSVELVLGANPRFAVTTAPTPGGVTVIVGAPPKPLAPGRYLLLNPSGPNAPVVLGAPVRTPRLTYWREEHPVLRRVILSDIVIGQATQATLPASATPLAGSPETPLLFAMVEGPKRVVGLTFDLDSSNLPLRVGFPVLVYNAIDWLVGPGVGEAPLRTLESEQPAVVRGPDGRPKEVSPQDGQLPLPDGATGFYTFTTQAGGALGTFAVSVTDPGETAIAVKETPAPSAGLAPGRSARDGELTPRLALIALALLLLEWFTYHRRKTV